MSPLIKNLLLALGLALIAWLGYSFFLKSDEAMVNSSNGSLVSGAVRDGQDFLIKLNQLKAIDLSGAIFNDPRFRSLEDKRQDVVSEPAGRDNPFLPYEGELEEAPLE